MEQALDAKSTRTLPAGRGALAVAVDHVLGGLPVAIPTETVYGLAADATNGEAVARIFAAKNRPSFNPLICHVTDIAMAEEFAVFDPVSRALADTFWPGALTLVLPLKNDHDIHPLVTAGLDTVAVRAPQGFGAKLIAAAGRPLAAPSANASGRISATTAEAVAESLGGRISLIVDGGPARVGVESTIVKVAEDRVDLLRPGGVSVEQIENVTGFPVSRSGGNAKIEAPGMMLSHYAPVAGVRLNAKTVEAGEALLGFGPKRADGADKAEKVLVLSESGDTIEAASNLFDFLRRLDACEARAIAVEPIPDEGLGEAINDRLRRAAAPRGVH